jgi:hypothetical protein
MLKTGLNMQDRRSILKAITSTLILPSSEFIDQPIDRSTTKDTYRAKYRRLTRMMEPPPPSKKWFYGTNEAWRKFEKHLGTKMPDDYKWFIRTYGAGAILPNDNRRFGDGVFRLLSPFDDDESFDVKSEFCKWIEEYKSICDDYVKRNSTVGIVEKLYDEPVKLLDAFPAMPGAIKIGGIGLTYVSDFCYHTAGSPNNWTVLVAGGFGMHYFDTGLGLVDFLLKVFDIYPKNILPVDETSVIEPLNRELDPIHWKWNWVSSRD